MFLFSKNKKVKKITKTDPKQKEKVSRIHFRNATGLTFILISVFLFIAFSSYLFKWKGDQSAVINRNFIELISNSDLQTENALGKVGAYVSHQLFYNGFGLSSFLIVGMFLLIGMKLSLHLKKISYLIVSKYSLFFLIWFSITLSLLNANSGFAWGGIVGNYSKDVLASFLGGVGVPILLFFSLLLFFVIEFKLNFDVALLKGMTFFKSGVPKMDGPVVELNIEEPIQVDEPVPATKEEVKDQPELELEIEEEEPKEENTVEVLLNVDEVEPLMEEEIDTDSEIKLGIEHTEEEKILDEEEAVITNYDPTLDLPNYKYPTVDLLNEIDAEKVKVDKEELKENTDQIMETLNNYNIQIERIKATIGPTVTLYEIVPTPGTRISKIKNLEDDIALSLSALGIRIIAPIPGKGTIGIEVPNKQREIVPIRTMLSSEKFQLSQMDLPIVLGKTIANEFYIADLASMPHLLVAGATGQGKSVGINSILISLLYKKHPSQLKFVLVDPKRVELSIYKTIRKHFLATLPNDSDAIITDSKLIVYAINSLCNEMDQRYLLLQKAMVRNIKEYNTKFVDRKLSPKNGHRFLPYLVLVIDEFADLIMTLGKEIEKPIARLAQLARAIGIHLIIATQRPSVNIITGTIKANFPARIAFKVTSKIDSRTILDAGGAEQLVGMGDLLFSHTADTIRLQSPFVSTEEVDRVTEFISEQPGVPQPFVLPEYIDENVGSTDPLDPNDRDELFEQAAELIVSAQQGSTSFLQRRLKLGYNRAGRLMDQLEAAGIVGAQVGSKPRDVLMTSEYELEQFLNKSE